MNETQILRAFEKANRNKGLTTDQLHTFLKLASRYAQVTLDFILSLLQRNEKSQVTAVITAARAALNGPDFTDGVHEVFAAAKVTGFPTPDAVVGYGWILEACQYACENYTTPSPVEEAAIPVLQ